MKEKKIWKIHITFITSSSSASTRNFSSVPFFRVVQKIFFITQTQKSQKKMKNLLAVKSGRKESSKWLNEVCVRLINQPKKCLLDVRQNCSHYNRHDCCEWTSKTDFMALFILENYYEVCVSFFGLLMKCLWMQQIFFSGFWKGFCWDCFVLPWPSKINLNFH